MPSTTGPTCAYDNQGNRPGGCHLVRIVCSPHPTNLHSKIGTKTFDRLQPKSAHSFRLYVRGVLQRSSARSRLLTLLPCRLIFHSGRHHVCYLRDNRGEIMAACAHRGTNNNRKPTWRRNIEKVEREEEGRLHACLDRCFVRHKLVPLFFLGNYSSFSVAEKKPTAILPIGSHMHFLKFSVTATAVSTQSSIVSWMNVSKRISSKSSAVNVW